MALPFLETDYQHATAVLPQTGAAIGAGDFVSMSKILKLYILVTFAYGADADCVISVLEDDDVAGTSASTLSKDFKIWANLDVSASNAFPPQTDAANYTIDAGAGKSQKVLIMVRPEQLNDGQTAVAVNIGNSDAANLISAEYFAVPRYPDDVSILTDL
jgi:hypothetical protein